MPKISGWKKSLLALVIIIAALGAVLISRFHSLEDADLPAAAIRVNDLQQYKSRFVGDNSNTINLIDHLPYAKQRKEVTLQTDKPPYGVTVTYDFGDGVDNGQLEAGLRSNALLMFALIENLDIINFKVVVSGQEHLHSFNRAELQKTTDLDDLD